MKNFNLIEVKLIKLINLVFKKLEETRKQKYGDIKHLPEKFFKPKFEIINNRMSGSFGYQTFNQKKNIVKFQVFEDQLNEFKQYKEIIELLTRETDFSDIFLNSTLTQFINNAINTSIDQIDNTIIKTQISLLNSLLSENLVIIKVKIYYQGLWLNSEEISINSHIKLRRIKPEDLIFNNLDLLREEMQNLLDIPQSILEYTFCKKYNQNDLESNLYEVDLQEELNLLDYVFLLYKLGCVFFKKEIITRNFYSLQIMNTLTNPMTPTLDFISYLDINDARKIKHLYQLLKKPEIRIYFSITRKTTKHLDISIKQYYNLFNFSENLQSGITSAVMCLEALFTENKPQLGRSLRERLSILFSTFGFSPLSIKSIVKEAYKIRSKYSHGSLSEKSFELIYRTTHQILEITRLSLLITLQMDYILSDINKLSSYYSKRTIRSLSGNSKQKLITLIDNAILDDIFYKKLKRFSNKECLLFI